MKKAACCTILLILIIFLTGARIRAATPRYTCVDLDKIAGPDVSGIYPCSIDAAGDIVGYAYPRSISQAPVLPKSGVKYPYAFMFVSTPHPAFFFVPMEVIVYPVPPNRGFTAEEISANGWHICGKLERLDNSGNTETQAWVGNRATGEAIWDLGTLGGKDSWCNAVNDAGQAVGGARDASGFSHPFLYSGGVMQPLPALSPENGEAHDINNAGQVVGWYSGGAFLYDGTIHDLGTLPPGGDGFSCAYAINEAGHVVGHAFISIDPMPVYHAFLWDGGPDMKDLGTLPGCNISSARDINNAGQVVGYSASPGSDSRAFLYTGGVMLDLTDLVVNLPAGVVLNSAGGINDRGQIIAMANNGHAYRLTPAKPLPPINMLLHD